MRVLLVLLVLPVLLVLLVLRWRYRHNSLPVRIGDADCAAGWPTTPKNCNCKFD
jgi:hypothetical protein